MTDTATATETQITLTVAVPQSPEEELFGAGVQVREQRVTNGFEITVEFDDAVFRRALEAVPLPQLDEAMEETRRRLSRAIAMGLAIPPHVWRAQMHGSFAPSIPLPVGQVAHPAYRPEHWHGVYDWRASAACCTPSRRAMTGGRPTSAGGGSLGGKVTALGRGGG